jgi:uncharacterized protein with PIN domain
MDGEHLGAGWAAVTAEVARELADWRSAHPRATLAEIEQVVYEAMGRLQARVLSDLAHASAAADLGAPAAERPRCPDCGGALVAGGRHEREVLTPRQAAALRLRRSYAVCTACGGGLFPPGR